MEYTINRTTRNMIILSSSFLIVYILIVRLFFFLNGPTEMDPLQIVIQKIIYLIPFGYLMWIFIDYFRHYKLKVLQISILAILIVEVILRIGLFSNILDSTWKQTIFLTTNVIWMIATIILIVFLFQIKGRDYRGILPIRKYAIGILLFFLLGTIVTFFVKPVNTFATQQLVELASAIPYIFTIDFALKLYLKE